MSGLIIFDLWNTLVEVRGKRFVERIADLVAGLSNETIDPDEFQDFIRATGCLHQEIDVDELAAEFWRYRFSKPAPLSLTSQSILQHEQFVRSARYMEGVEEAIRKIKAFDIPICIVSNATSASVEVVEALGVADQVDEVWLSCKSTYLKPDPRAFITAAEHFDVSPSQCFVVGDKMTTDILGARLAGMNALQVSPTMDELVLSPNASMLAIGPSVGPLVDVILEWTVREDGAGGRP